MQLKDWRKEHRLTLSEVGRRLSRSPSTVMRWELPPSDSRRTLPSYDDIRAIAAMTGGQVTPNDFYGLSEGAAE